MPHSWWCIGHAAWWCLYFKLSKTKLGLSSNSSLSVRPGSIIFPQKYLPRVVFTISPHHRIQDQTWEKVSKAPGLTPGSYIPWGILQPRSRKVCSRPRAPGNCASSSHLCLHSFHTSCLLYPTEQVRSVLHKTTLKKFKHQLVTSEGSVPSQHHSSPHVALLTPSFLGEPLVHRLLMKALIQG